MRFSGPSKKVGGGGWKFLQCRNFSKLAHVLHLARRRVGPAAAANSQGAAHSAAAFESRRSMAPALWACYFEVLGPKGASSSSNSQPRLQIRIASCDHKGRHKQPHVGILRHSWLQIRVAGCEHKGRQKQPQITTLMHYRLQIRIAGGDHRGSQQQRQMQIRIAGGCQKAPPKEPNSRNSLIRVGGVGRYPSGGSMFYAIPDESVVLLCYF